MFAAQDIRAGGRQSDSDYQYTLSSTDLDLLQKWAPIVGKRMETVEGITDVSSDRDPGGLQLTLSIDRKKASSLGVQVQDIDNALNNAFSQRQISIIYTQRNQYMVVLEIDPKFQSDPSNLEHIYRRRRQRRAGAAVGRGALRSAGLSPLAVYHSQSFPSTTVSFNLLPGCAAARSRPRTSSARSRNCTCPRAFAAASTAMPAISTRPAAGSRC